MSDQQVIRAEDTEWPWPQYPPGARRNYDRSFREAFTGWEGDFLDALRNTGIIRSACMKAKVSSSVVSTRKKIDPEFRKAWGEAMEQANDALLAAAYQRAVLGTKRYKRHYHKDQLLYTEEITEYSDSLLQFLIKGNMPERFGDKISHSYNITLIKQEVERIAQQTGQDPVLLLKETLEIAGLEEES